MAKQQLALCSKVRAALDSAGTADGKRYLATIAAVTALVMKVAAMP